MGVKFSVQGEEVHSVDGDVQRVSVRTARGEKASFSVVPEEQEIFIQIDSLYDGGYPNLDVVEAVRTNAQSEAREGKMAGPPAGDALAEAQDGYASVNPDDPRAEERQRKLEEREEQIRQERENAEGTTTGGSSGTPGITESRLTTGAEVAGQASPTSPTGSTTQGTTDVEGNGGRKGKDGGDLDLDLNT